MTDKGLKVSIRYLICALIMLPTFAFSANRVYNLYIRNKVFNFTGKPVMAIAINGQIPGPTLHFKEGDFAIINVYNRLKVPTTLHWHGLLLPWRMDGVSWVTQVPIPPGGVYHYKFKVRQYGTYWYHSHYEIQEQRGQYGAIIIDPPHKHFEYNKDFVIVLSDWINTDPNQVFNNLKKTGDYYTNKFPLQTSLFHYLSSIKHATPKQRLYIKKTYRQMQKTRMGVYGLSDVAYQTFLLNGRPPSRLWKGKVKVGDVVRLRIIGAGASTYFNVKIPGTTLKVINYDGNNTKPYFTDHLTMGPGETYDVLVKITHKNPYIIYAEGLSTIGAAVGALVTNTQQAVDIAHITPFPEPKPRAMQPIRSASQLPIKKYEALRALHKTNNPNKPVHVIRMKLSGYMDRYMWFINGKLGYNVKPIPIEYGKRYRIIYTNATLMRHPMHIHGHWFILRNGHGAYDPLIHTVDVPPFHTVTVDFDANEPSHGQWFMHCHNLYHLSSGMDRIFRYTTPAHASAKVSKTQSANNAYSFRKYPSGNSNEFALLNGPTLPWFYRSFIAVGGDFWNSTYQATARFEGGSDYNKLQLFTNEAEMSNGTVDTADVDVFYQRLISQFWNIKGGANYVYRPAKHSYWQPGLGIEGLMPFFIATDLRTYLHDGSFKVDLELSRDTWIYKRFFINFGLRGIWATKTIADDMIGSGLNQLELTVTPYIRLNPRMVFFVSYEHDAYFSRLKILRAADGELSRENLVFIGFTLLL